MYVGERESIDSMLLNLFKQYFVPEIAAVTLQLATPAFAKPRAEWCYQKIMREIIQMAVELVQ